MRKIILLLAIIAHAGVALAQKVGSWNVYPSYMNATQNVTTGSYVFGLMNGNLLRYDTDDQTVETYNSLEHLSDMGISHIAWCQDAKTLVIVYTNGNIDLMDLDNNVWNLDDLKKSSLNNKTINGICIDGTTAYVCTDFGFLDVDVAGHVIMDTYVLGRHTTGVKLTEEYLYLCDGGRVLSCPAAANWKVSTNWRVSTDYVPADIAYAPTEYNPAGGLFWHSDGLEGLNGYKLQDDEYVRVSGPIQPNSPMCDLFYRMHYAGNRILISGGINTPYALYNPTAAMIYEDGVWSYLDDSPVSELDSRIIPYNTTHLVQDPTDDTHHFSSPYRCGLFEYRDGKLVKVYNSDNSPLRSIFPKSPNYLNFTSAVALHYDGEGNLWMANQQTDTIMRILTPEGKWYSPYYAEIDSTPTVYDYLFSTSGINFLINHRVDGRGFFGFTTNGTLDTTDDDRHVLRTTITNEDGTQYTPDRFYCMTEDLDGQIWCGTNLGLFVIEDPTTYFNDDFTFLQIKLPRNDGSGLADYLLSGVDVTCIAVDGANRKWIGTASSGVYLVSADGLETIHHFTTDNSPIISDEIQCLLVNPDNGEVFIGTDSGLCSYIGAATDPEDKLDYDNTTVFPNPVSPDFGGVVTIDGLTANAEVKICSSTGQLINSGRSNGGRFTWNLKTKQGRRVSSGVYNVISNTSNGKNAIVNRIVVIK